MQRDRFVVARRRLRGASADLALAETIVATFTARAAFHAQQASEMALKALLVAATDDHPTTHSTSTLVRELREVPFEIPDDVGAAASALDLYFLTSRYPDAVGDAVPLDVVLEDDVMLAVSRARRVVGFAMAAVARLAGAESDV